MNNVKKLVIAWSLVISIIIFTGCTTTNGSEKDKTNVPATSVNESTTIMFTDDVGREVELPKQIDRIAPMGTLAQITLFTIAPDKFVGLSSDWSDKELLYLEDRYKDLPVFGQFYGGSGGLNMEALAVADPQVIIDVGEVKESAVEDLNSIQEQLGIPTIFIKATTDSMSDAYKKLGELLGAEEAANQCADYCEKTYKNTTAVMDEIGEQKVNLLYCLGDKGTSVIAKDTYFSEVLDLIGNNVAVVEEPSSKGSGNEVDFEQILNWNPDIILFAPDSIYSSVSADEAWMELDAIKNNTYYEVPYGPYNWMGFPPAINKYMGMIWLSDLLYPDKFHYDLYEETKTFYKLFYHYNLSEDEFNKMVEKSTGKEKKIS